MYRSELTKTAAMANNHPPQPVGVAILRDASADQDTKPEEVNGRLSASSIRSASSSSMIHNHPPLPPQPLPPPGAHRGIMSRPVSFGPLGQGPAPMLASLSRNNSISSSAEFSPDASESSFNGSGSISESSSVSSSIAGSRAGGVLPLFDGL